MKVGNLIQDRHNEDIGLVVEVHKSKSGWGIPWVSILWASSRSVTKEEMLDEFLEVVNEGR